MGDGLPGFRAGPALWVNGKESLHPDAPGHFDVRLTRRVIRELKGLLAEDGRAHLRPSANADWAEVELRRAEMRCSFVSWSTSRPRHIGRRQGVFAASAHWRDPRRPSALH